MDDEEFQHRQMLHEYDTLRTELLQIYEQQSRLIFSATITAIAAFIGALIQIQRPEFPAALILPTVLAVLLGVCWKSFANYLRIFRIGGYLTVVLERQGKTEEDFKPGLYKAAWHSRWRMVSR